MALGRTAHIWLVRGLRALLLLLLLLGAALSVLPFMGLNAWWVRVLEFPRLQFMLVTAGLLLLALAIDAGRSLVGLLVLASGAAGLGIHAGQLLPYAPFAKRMAISVETCAPGSTLRLMIANVQKSDESAERLLTTIREMSPELLLVMETDVWWDEALRPLHDAYPYRVQHIPEDAVAYGLHLLSRWPLEEARMEFWFDTVTPTALAVVELPDARRVRLIGLHPRPPLPPDQSSTMRDAHLLRAALEARGSDLPVILAGDLNATPWARVVRRTMRLGGLLDPRMGRGLHPTFSAENWWMAWPLDHVLYQERFGLEAWQVLPAFGSDHHPVLVNLCLDSELAAIQSAPLAHPGDVAAAEHIIRAADLLNP